MARTEGRRVHRPLRYRVIRGSKRRSRWGGDADCPSQDPPPGKTVSLQAGQEQYCKYEYDHSSWGRGGVLLCKGKEKVPEAWDTSRGSLCQEQSAGFSAGGAAEGNVEE